MALQMKRVVFLMFLFSLLFKVGGQSHAATEKQAGAVCLVQAIKCTNSAGSAAVAAAYSTLTNTVSKMSDDDLINDDTEDETVHSPTAKRGRLDVSAPSLFPFQFYSGLQQSTVKAGLPVAGPVTYDHIQLCVLRI
ncbi:MAG: hypothetical protein QM640_06295 [Niabella sp.]